MSNIELILDFKIKKKKNTSIYNIDKITLVNIRQFDETLIYNSLASTKYILFLHCPKIIQVAIIKLNLGGFGNGDSLVMISFERTARVF